MKKNSTQKKTLIFFLILCVSFFIYCLLGVIQTVFLFGVGPNFSTDRLSLNLKIWGGFAIVSFCLSICLCLWLYSIRKGRNPQ